MRQISGTPKVNADRKEKSVSDVCRRPAVEDFNTGRSAPPAVINAIATPD
jgi:hypothetical protein